MTDVQLDVPLEDLSAFSLKMQDISRSAGSFSTALTGGLKAALVDGKSLEAVFRQIALTTSSRLLGSALKPLEGLTETAFSSVFGGLTNGISGSVAGALGAVTPFAKGGIVASPTYFGLGGDGASGGLGLAGEAGAEAILPLVRGNDGRLGVHNGTGAAQPRVQINVATRDAESFRRSETQVSAMVARAVGRGRRGL
ncbi:phage tail tape measure protein [uncultured Roseibium sp.]|uniref:phage tail tape measure protein n=1 Tax=uncultured Roseibium sp. TaxID=1936171 RepID=UPI00259775D7|nr:phage tail tape measure protein [uncultured Roseibium sp.]